MKPKPQSDGIAAGQPIPGSRYVRAFCDECGEPMRVSKDCYEEGRYSSCSDCTRSLPLGHGTQNDTGEYDESDGAWDNAVRAMEDAGDAA